MGYREKTISKSILDAIFLDKQDPSRGILTRIFVFFSFFHLALQRFSPSQFKKLRTESWQLDEEEYKESFRRAARQGQLSPIGDLGYSGSTFFTTPNSKYLIKSIPRKFEHDFFRNILLDPYVAHIRAHPSSLLVRITDLLYAPTSTLGALLGFAPSHHIIMENVLYGKDAHSGEAYQWETYDLKPADYFYPERDVAGGNLASDSTKSKLIDIFGDKVRVSNGERREMLATLEADTMLLREVGAVDYSLFLIRYPQGLKPPQLPSGTDEPWRNGLESTDGQWVYRAVILDFFWAKSALQAKAMEALIRGYNLLDLQGPMSITTSPAEYQKRFMEMVAGIVISNEAGDGGEIHGQGSSEQ
ncbi:SAICAR synthase-like protein [Pseudovirgaria hyperparasitica]|uniref:SAICAR synthase-like protein n=1 Tax=Pseudovirgaria hyperparasitica TaxID=470096 RepID=A0A6A6VUB1_9PEZI|nr:SAICAR synthase-like protein [Pseudovirgaria hyperparasitica]KAF2753324.1 SAICAR synthase-like protein [Pseudovirgaria hyperparasitica]